MANIFFRCDFSSVPTGEREREGNKKKKKILSPRILMPQSA